jgi:hypothetical protein
MATKYRTVRLTEREWNALWMVFDLGMRNCDGEALDWTMEESGWTAAANRAHEKLGAQLRGEQ